MKSLLHGFNKSDWLEQVDDTQGRINRHLQDYKPFVVEKKVKKREKDKSIDLHMGDDEDGNPFKIIMEADLPEF
jgi:hypothetical protein